MGVRGPVRGGCTVLGPDAADGVVERDGGAFCPRRASAGVGEDGVEVEGYSVRGRVVDRPQRADDVPVAGQLEGSGDMDGLISEPGARGACAACR
jgi:hypothetical protein